MPDDHVEVVLAGHVEVVLAGHVEVVLDDHEELELVHCEAELLEKHAEEVLE